MFQLYAHYVHFVFLTGRCLQITKSTKNAELWKTDQWMYLNLK